jgi:hypothetical protein
MDGNIENLRTQTKNIELFSAAAVGIGWVLVGMVGDCVH